MSSLYGCLTLSDTPKLVLTVPELSSLDSEVKHGYHLPSKKDTDEVSAGFFMMRAEESTTVFVPSRQEKLDANLTGSLVHPQGLTFLIRLLLMLNSEKNEMKLADIVYERLYKHIDTQGHYLAVISQSSPHSRLIFLSKGIKLYLTGVTNSNSNFLVWSNEEDLELRMREEYKNKYYYYRFPHVLDRCLVLQTQFICTKFRRWRGDIQDRLRVFSILENQIFKAAR